MVNVPLSVEGKGKGAGGFHRAIFIKVMEDMWEQVKGWYPHGQAFKVVLDNVKQYVSKQIKKEYGGMGVPLLGAFLHSPMV